MKKLTGIELIAIERERQIIEEGFSIGADQKYENEELAFAAACYSAPTDFKLYRMKNKVPLYWPWPDKWWKPSPDDRVRELVKAGALIAAEIDRLRVNEKETA